MERIPQLGNMKHEIIRESKRKVHFKIIFENGQEILGSMYKNGGEITYTMPNKTNAQKIS